MLIRFTVKETSGGHSLVMRMLLYHIVLLILLACTAVESSILDGPESVVGTVDEDVTLKCRTNEQQKVTWTFTPIGQDVSLNESNFPGHHRTSWSTRGYHLLTLQGLKFQNAGRYVCRVVGASEEGGLDAAAAFVVVVADAPRCKHNIIGQLTYNDSVSLECSITFLGQHNLTLEWLAPDGEVIVRHDYASGNVADVARLGLSVKAQTAWSYNQSTPGYTCRAYFSNWTTDFKDVASNSPEFRRNTCTVLLPAPTVSPTDASTLPPASSETAPFVSVAAVAGLLVGVVVTVVVVCVCVGPASMKAALRRGRRRHDRGRSDDPENVSNSARCVSHYDHAAAAGGSEMKTLISSESKDDKYRGGDTADDYSESAGKEVVDSPSEHEPELSGFSSQKDSEGPTPATSKIAAGQQPAYHSTEGDLCPSGNSPKPNGVQTHVRVNDNAVLPTTRQEPSNDSPNSVVTDADVHQSLEPSPNDSSDRPVTPSEAESTRASVQEHVDSDMPGQESTTQGNMYDLHSDIEDQVESNDK